MRLRYDNAFGTLGASQAAGDLTITFAAALTYADGIQVPTLTGGSTIDITVEPNSTNFEVERITAYTQGALTATVSRGISGSAKPHLSGVAFGHNPTAGGDFNGGTPSLALGTTNTAGTSGTPFDAASGVAVFDTTVPVTQNYSDVAATGSASVAARRDHKHGMPAISGVTWPLTNTGDETFQPNAIANNTLTLHNNASAVNGLQIVGTATGSAVQINPLGSDSNLGLTTNLVGDSVFTIARSSAIQDAVFRVTGNSGTSLFTLSQIAGPNGDVSTGTLHLTNSGTNLALASGSQITDSFASELSIVSNNGVTALRQTNLSGALMLKVSGTGGAVNYIAVTNAATGNAPAFTATGTDSTIDLTLGTKGTGLINIGYATTALGGGATATLGTIGGSGPTTAAQLCWVAFKVNGTTTFFPGWR